MELRDYQIEALNKIKEMNKGSKNIIEIATGGGKTIIFSKLVAENEGRSLIIIDQEELLQQTVDKLSYFTDEKIGRVKGVLNEVSDRILVGTRQSITYPGSDRMERILANGEIDYLIIDECHIALEQQKKIIEKIGAKYVLGFSATPFANGTEKVYDNILYKKDILKLVKQGYLVSPRCLVCESNVNLDGISMTLGDFNQKELNETIDIEDRNKFIVKKWVEYASDRMATIVFCSSIDNAKNIRDEFKKAGINCESVDSDLDSKEREDILRRFEEGEIKVLCNVNILTKGVDITRVDCIIEATPTRSLMKYIQQIGRSLRLHEGKKDALILDITDNCKKHRLINCNTAFGLKDGEDILEMEERIKKEAEIEKLDRLEKEEQERIRKLKEEELIMKEIELFNESIFNVRENSIYDWYFNKIGNVDVAILKANKDIDFYIVSRDNNYTSYKRIQGEGYTYKLETISESNSLKELQEEIEDIARKVEKAGAYLNPKCSWKKNDNLTEKQVQACKGKKVKTIWDVLVYFSKRNSYFSLKCVI
ncbi:DEAD/DEAH box helicase [Clostridium tertium]|uniref:DEAD/DEAH box helicase n=1 Tax=Clostridium tertium TaxID=1559 RepID=A0A9X4B1Y6_9CLOT|nr:DEAD/DEAH box helicase [Clostridium tertium]MDC4240066.1 DEAD/DEAH box helicase [Clostridium tertium]